MQKKKGSHWEWEEDGLKVHGWADGDRFFHREGGPSSIMYYGNGRIKSEKWRIHGVNHREGGPAFVAYFPDGKLEWESWWLHGQRHREGAPALIIYDKDGIKDVIGGDLWYLHGKDEKALYPKEVYQEMQNLLGRENLWNFIWKKCNLAILLSGFF